MHYSWHENPKEIMTQKCYDVLKNAILSAIANDKIRRRVERKPKKKKKVAADIFKRKKYNCKVSISILLIILVNAVPRT